MLKGALGARMVSEVVKGLRNLIKLGIFKGRFGESTISYIFWSEIKVTLMLTELGLK